MPSCQFERIYPYHPEYLQAWALVSLVCGIALLAEALATPTAFLLLRRRSLPRWQLAFALAPLAGATGAFLLANFAQMRYWFFTTQVSAVLGVHGGSNDRSFWGCWTQYTVEQVQGLGIVVAIGGATLLLMGAFLAVRWVRSGRTSAPGATASQAS